MTMTMTMCTTLFTSAADDVCPPFFSPPFQVAYLEQTFPGKLSFNLTWQEKDEMQAPDFNKPMRVVVGGTEVYNRLQPDGSNKVAADDPHPSDDATAEFGEKGGRVRQWGPIIVSGGNAWWGGPTPGKVEAARAAIAGLLAAQ